MTKKEMKIFELIGMLEKPKKYEFKEVWDYKIIEKMKSGTNWDQVDFIDSLEHFYKWNRIMQENIGDMDMKKFYYNEEHRLNHKVNFLSEIVSSYRQMIKELLLKKVA